MDDFLLRAGLAGAAVALVAGPLGCFVIWRRWAYFGDTLAHATLLGVALGMALDTSADWGVLIVCCVVAGLLALARSRRQIAGDTLLGIVSHTALALGLLAIAAMGEGGSGGGVDLTALLFGDVLAVTWQDLLHIAVGDLVVLTVLVIAWRPMLATTIDADLAIVEGIPVTLIDTVTTLLIAITVAFAMKILGALLITALLIIPAATARLWSRTPEIMAVGAAGVGIVAVGLGLAGSWYADMPAGPAIIAAAAVLFAVGWGGRIVR